MRGKTLDFRRFLPETITSVDMAVIDENCASLGVPRRILMENAGAAVARTMDEQYSIKGKRVVIAAGTGNNGGDGLVAARHLRNQGCKVSVCLLGNPHDIRTDEAKESWDVLNRGRMYLSLIVVNDSSHIDLLVNELEKADFVVDALLGTGVKGNLKEPTESAVLALNKSKLPITAVDTPTGLDPSTGDIAGVAVRAATTVTFHRMKTGFDKRKKYTGEVMVVDIGVPLEAELFTGPGDVRRVVKPRPVQSHKGDYGYILVIGGSECYSGAPALAAMAAMRTGVGLVFVAAPKGIATAVRSFSPDLIVSPLPNTHITARDLPKLRELMGKVDAIILGPGIGLHPDTSKAVGEVVRYCQARKSPIVIDADGLKTLADLKVRLAKSAVLTPHAGEFKALSGIDVAQDWRERVGPAVDYARGKGCTLVLKGHETIITDGTRLKVNEKGNPSMATGGTGDILSGIIGAFLAQGVDPFQAASAATYVNGAAGDLAYSKRGFHLTASDLLEGIPEVLKPFDTTID